MSEVKNDILSLVEKHCKVLERKEFIPGVSSIPVTGKVFDSAEVVSLIESCLDFWLTTGRFNDEFETLLKRFVRSRFALTVNSGSSANLVAFMSLTSHLLGERAIKHGDEVISVAAGFPTTVNPIIQAGCIPVFVDVDIPTYNIQVEKIESAITSKTKAIFIAHTLGNPYNLSEIRKICDKHNLWLIEDCCDALGATYNNQHVGTFGDIGTLSFYPAHHITMGEGGAVFTNNPIIKRAMQAIRDWGRDCWCEGGVDNSCGKRFEQQHGDLPFGYDHKYVYSHLGYNLKITDMQAAVGVAQIRKLPEFVETRRKNFNILKQKFQDNGLDKFFILPQATENSNPSWFGFALSIKNDVKFSRRDLLVYLTEKKIGTRLLFGGNLTKQPYMIGRNFRVHDNLNNTDIIMNNTFWIGCYHEITEEMIDYMVDCFVSFVEKK
jgi:CDP-6-deoxy-D-xylo-4-hexulose-3-dehydrase